MNTKMYVGNLSFDASELDLRDLFGAHGEVTDVYLPKDRESGRPRGFAFVSMDTTEAMNAAIEQLNGQDFLGRALNINEARPQGDGTGAGGGGRSFAGGGGGGGGRSFGGGGGGGGSRGGYSGGGGGGGGRDSGGYRSERRDRDSGGRGGFGGRR